MSNREIEVGSKAYFEEAVMLYGLDKAMPKVIRDRIVINAVEHIDSFALNEIEFLLGSIEACNGIIKPYLEENGYTGQGFILMDKERDAKLILDIYIGLFAE